MPDRITSCLQPRALGRHEWAGHPHGTRRKINSAVARDRPVEAAVAVRSTSRASFPTRAPPNSYPSPRYYCERYSR